MCSFALATPCTGPTTPRAAGSNRSATASLSSTCFPTGGRRSGRIRRKAGRSRRPTADGPRPRCSPNTRNAPEPASTDLDHELAPHVTALEQHVSIDDVGQREDLLHGGGQVAAGQQFGQLGEVIAARPASDRGG